jgi:Ser/Thr protein kinase RdoA (MazF antagonist)
MTLSVVATQGASVVPAPEDIFAAVVERYGLASVVARRPLTGGYANDLYDVATDRGRFVVRVVRRPVDGAGLEWETCVAIALAAELPEVVAPLPALDGSTFFAHGHDAVLVLPFVDGVPADRGDAARRAEAAALLARLHSAGRTLTLDRRPGAARLAELRSAIADRSYYARIGPAAAAAAGARALPEGDRHGAGLDARVRRDGRADATAQGGP